MLQHGQFLSRALTTRDVTPRLGWLRRFWDLQDPIPQIIMTLTGLSRPFLSFYQIFEAKSTGLKRNISTFWNTPGS